MPGGTGSGVELAPTHRGEWTAIHLPTLAVGRRRREARRRRQLHEVEGLLCELRVNLGEGPSTLVGALEGYRRALARCSP
jgi:hypothetical protein